MFDLEVVQDPRDDEVDEVRDSLRLTIESRRRGEDDGAEASELQHVLQDDCTQRRLSGDEDQFAVLFQGHRRGPGDEVIGDLE